VSTLQETCEDTFLRDDTVNGHADNFIA
jgi:hypothetical protein